MAEIGRKRDRVVVKLDDGERRTLLLIVDQLAPRVGAVARTKPHAYEDLSMEAEYRRFTLPEVERTRSADIAAVRAALAETRDRWELDDPQALAWARALNHLRLVAGGLAGVDDDGWEQRAPGEAVELEMLHDLTWVQDAIVAALED
jgi:hypothetical protein